MSLNEKIISCRVTCHQTLESKNIYLVLAKQDQQNVDALLTIEAPPAKPNHKFNFLDKT